MSKKDPIIQALVAILVILAAFLAFMLFPIVYDMVRFGWCLNVSVVEGRSLDSAIGYCRSRGER